jgi:hypothetical protein
MSVIVLGPNPLLRIGQRTIVIGRIRSRPQQLLLRPRNKLKVGLPTQSERSALPVKTLHTCQSCIYREASASLYHTTHLLILKRQAEFTNWREGEEWRIFWRGLSVLV